MRVMKELRVAAISVIASTVSCHVRWRGNGGWSLEKESTQGDESDHHRTRRSLPESKGGKGTAESGVMKHDEVSAVLN